MIACSSFPSARKKVDTVAVTAEIAEAVKKNGWKDGVLTAFVPHCTAALFVNEFDQSLKEDYAEFFGKLATGKWRHDSVDDNAAAHLMSRLVGASRQFFVEKGEIRLGSWQSIILLELDGPRERSIWLQFCRR
ncbi:MAG: secondary thiamine-phosphate synthase enzyme YjbQ [Candidatus Micrarchaeota archaeon]